MKTLKELIKALSELQTRGDGKVLYYNPEFKKDVLDYHYENNISLFKLARDIGMSNAILYCWKREDESQLTAIKTKKRLMIDVRSKCLVVKQYLSGEVTAHQLAEKYNISHVNTIYRWVQIYKDTFQANIDNLPDGVPYIAQEEKLVYGDKNILEARAKLQENIDLLTKISVNIDMGRIEKKTISDLIKKESSKKKELDNAMAILQKHGVSI